MVVLALRGGCMFIFSQGLFTTLLLVTCPAEALAYLDPGSGSYFFQILIAAMLGGAYTIKVYFKKIVKFITDILSKTNK